MYFKYVCICIYYNIKEDSELKWKVVVQMYAKYLGIKVFVCCLEKTAYISTTTKLENVYSLNFIQKNSNNAHANWWLMY